MKKVALMKNGLIEMRFEWCNSRMTHPLTIKEAKEYFNALQFALYRADLRKHKNHMQSPSEAGTAVKTASNSPSGVAPDRLPVVDREARPSPSSLRREMSVDNGEQ